MAMKFYVLCSKNIKATKRHLDTISREDIYYVFNSQDAEYVTEAAAGWDVIWPEGYTPDLMNLVNFPGPEEVWWDANAGAPVGSSDGNDHLTPRA